jgi:hypothetical protein
VFKEEEKEDKSTRSSGTIGGLVVCNECWLGWVPKNCKDHGWSCFSITGCPEMGLYKPK